MERASYTSFEGFRRVASGGLGEVAARTKEVLERGEGGPVLIFDDRTGEQVELDFRGTTEDVLARLAEPGGEGSASEAEADAGAAAPRGPGRPRLGVVAREVTLLPRHWEWLNGQPGGASVALRKLVEEARRANAGRDRVRRCREAAYRFLSSMAGNLPGFEESARALFAGDAGRFAATMAGWPADVRDQALRLASGSFAGEGGASCASS